MDIGFRQGLYPIEAVKSEEKLGLYVKISYPTPPNKPKLGHQHQQSENNAKESEGVGLLTDCDL